LICDSSQKESLIQVVSDTRVVATTVGPYTLYGSPLLSLCAQLGTSYCDITGELDWVRDMIAKYHNTAKDSGARIIHMCGNDSIPWDISVAELAKALKHKGDELKSVSFFDELVASPSGGTIETVYLISNAQKVKYPVDPLSLTADGQKSTVKVSLIDPKFPTWSPEMKKWTGFFVMTSANCACVRRSASVLHYSNQFTYHERQVHSGVFDALNLQIGLMMLGISLFFSPTRWIARKFVFPAVGSGPSKESMDKGFLKVNGFAKGAKGNTVKSVLYFPTDSAYRDTARMIVETGLALALNANKLEVGGGVYTPACIGSDILLERLRNTGCYWNLE